MEDAVPWDSQKASENSSFHFFGVYDGHGGVQASNFCKDSLHQALIEELRDKYMKVMCMNIAELERKLEEDHHEVQRINIDRPLHEQGSNINVNLQHNIENALLAEGCFSTVLELTAKEIERMFMEASWAEYLRTLQQHGGKESASGAEPSSSRARTFIDFVTSINNPDALPKEAALEGMDRAVDAGRIAGLEVLRLILSLCLSEGFDTFPSLLCVDGCSMFDRMAEFAVSVLEVGGGVFEDVVSTAEFKYYVAETGTVVSQLLGIATEMVRPGIVAREFKGNATSAAGGFRVEDGILMVVYRIL